ncbi:MAG TPA: hypothetical protein DD490_11590 [Acidobacteria bacterium]|nr:hypothetical protein [Acidobacteriota bacterium]
MSPVPSLAPRQEERKLVGQHDRIYRSLFAFPRMVEEVMRGFIREPWVERLDFSTLQRENASFVSANLKGRDGDIL